MALHTLKPDTMLREYRLIKLLGEGGFGLTYLAFDTHLEKHVAIKEYMPAEHAVRESDSKIVPRSSASEKTYNWGLNAFLNEAKTLAKFENPSIVRIHRFFKENGTAYIVMEYCEGGCLIDMISKDKPMNENRLKEIITSVVNGLHLVHKEGILHRDIKPDNIMFRKDGTAVLIDFGAARQAIGDKSRKVTTIITPGYAPLEQYSTKGKVGPWSDIYSLAAVAYLCLTGKKPPDIMNRLHDDTITKLSEQINSSRFLRAIDQGLGLQVHERPKNLSDWSSIWSTSNTSESPTQANETSQAIIAKKGISPQTHYFKPQAISARPEISARDQTTINANTIEQKSSFGFLKALTMLISLLTFSVVAYVAYQHFVNKQEIDSIINLASIKEKWNTSFATKTEDIIQPIHDQRIVNTQKKLNKLGYKVIENGILDVRTQQSIKKFEEDNQLVVIGLVDDILINELTNKIKSLELKKWQNTTAKNTENALLDYRIKNPNSPFNKEINTRIESLRRLKRQEQEQQEQQEEELKQKLAIANENNQKQKLITVAREKKKLINSIQSQLIRLKYFDLNQTGNLDLQTKSLIKTYQKLKNLPQNGLPTKTLLFKLKSETRWPGKKIGETFRACKNCPQMVVLKAGSFIMGNEKGASTQKPAHSVYIKEFSISQLPINFKQWDACYDNGFCRSKPNDNNPARETNAMTNVSYEDSQQFIGWLKSLSGQNYQLPSEAQWEYAAHSTVQANPYRLQGSQDPLNSINPMKEIIKDCWHKNYLGAPSDGSAWLEAACLESVTRENIINKEVSLQYKRGKIAKNKRLKNTGFRVVIAPN